jgi:hypothetical protein
MRLVVAATAALLSLAGAGTGVTVAHADSTPAGPITCIDQLDKPVGIMVCIYCTDAVTQGFPEPVDRTVDACVPSPVDVPLTRLVPVI